MNGVLHLTVPGTKAQIGTTDLPGKSYRIRDSRIGRDKRTAKEGNYKGEEKVWEDRRFRNLCGHRGPKDWHHSTESKYP